MNENSWITNSWMLYGLLALIAIVVIALIVALVVVYRKKQSKTSGQVTPETPVRPPEKVGVDSADGLLSDSAADSAKKTGATKGTAKSTAEELDSTKTAGATLAGVDSATRSKVEPAIDSVAEPETSEAAIADRADADTETAVDPDSKTSTEDETDATPSEAAQLEVETPESVPSRLQRLRTRLAKSGGFGRALLSVFSRGDLQASDWEEIEDTLLLADVGMSATEEIIENLRTAVKVEGTVSADKARELLRKELLSLVDPDLDRSLNLTQPTKDGQQLPACVLVVGVNGTGKTTTVGKMARLLRAENQTVLLGAADTFRAAAAEQLTTWGERVGVEVVSSEKEGADPASVAFEAVKQGIEQQVEVVIVDTAGRLQTKSTLMDELGKVKRVMEKQAPVGEVLLVLDATTGQNGLRQAQVFGEVAGVTGIVLTKLDGSAKGGIVISVQKELGVPVKLVGLGEGPDDLAPFVPEDFVESLLAGTLS